MFERLRKLLPSHLAAEVAPRWEAYVRDNPGAGATTFLARLHGEGVIDAGQLKDALGAVPVDVDVTEDGGDPDLLQGDRYQLVGTLGKGAMGEVSIALDRRLNRSVAVKRMFPEVAQQNEMARRFFTEARITAQLDHPGIVPVYSFEVRDDGTREYGMKLIRGKTLEDVITEALATYAAGGVPDDDHALPSRLDLFLQVCNAMDYAHSRGVIHRDLKPENVMVGPFHEVIVMDWGIARRIGATEGELPVIQSDNVARTQIGIVIGTPRYMSPEQAEARNEELDGHSDQYALGLILYELIALRPARTGRTAVEIVTRAQLGEMPALIPAHPKVPVPDPLRAIVAKATALELEDRYPSVDALADDVRRYLRDEEILARPDSTLQRAQRWVSHHRTATLGAMFALVLAVFGVAAVGVIGGAVALETSRRTAAAREAALTRYLGDVTGQAHEIDTRLRHYEALVAGLAFAAKEALVRPAPVAPLFLDTDFREGRGPDDLAPSDIYPRPVSLDHPDLAVSPHVDPAAIRPRLYQLVSLQPALKDVMLMSHDPDSMELDPGRQSRLIRTRGTPVVWSYVGIEEGVLVGYPGTGEYPEDYDVLGRPWYQQAKSSRSPQWGALDIDESGLGLLLTCNMAVHAPDGRFLGVAAIDIAFQYLSAELLEPKGTPYTVRAWLVDADGNTVVDSSLAEEAGGIKAWTPPPFPFPEVLEAAEAHDDGQLEVAIDGTPHMVAWTDLSAVPFTYVVAAPRAEVYAAR